MRKSAVDILVFLAALFSPGCVMPNGIGNENLTGGLHGTITGAGGAPLDSVFVSLLGANSTRQAITGPDGRYDLAGVPPGTYDLSAFKLGYYNATVRLFKIQASQSREWSVALKPIPTTGSLRGVVKNLRNASLENAFVILSSNSSSYNCSTDKDGEYNLTGVPAGSYAVMVGKQGFRNVTGNLTILQGKTYAWNFTIRKDCTYYTVNSSANYALRYGYNGTVYRGYVFYVVPYPEGSSYAVYPPPDASLSQFSTTYRAGNRMLSWKLDNSGGGYAYVQGHLYLDMSGTQSTRLFDRKEMTIQDASASQPSFLGIEIYNGENRKTMIDPYNSEIKAIAEQVKGETGSEDAWTVAKAMYTWLKNNTDYYHEAGSGSQRQSAIEVLHSRMGDCDELSILYISLCRAAGIPARFVDGYLVEKDPKDYIGHEWVEFYDGEWVPVDVAASENKSYSNGVTLGKAGNITHLIDTRFGVSLPSHVKTFVDDGTSESLIADSGKGRYYDTPPSFRPYVYYDLEGYDQKYIASCSDGTRELVDEKE